MNIQSNLKIIDSGSIPTTSNLEKGSAAFGKVDGRYRLYGNSDDTIQIFSGVSNTGDTMAGEYSLVDNGATKAKLTATEGVFGIPISDSTTIPYNIMTPITAVEATGSGNPYANVTSGSDGGQITLNKRNTDSATFRPDSKTLLDLTENKSYITQLNTSFIGGSGTFYINLYDPDNLNTILKKIAINTLNRWLNISLTYVQSLLPTYIKTTIGIGFELTLTSTITTNNVVSFLILPYNSILEPLPDSRTPFPYQNPGTTKTFTAIKNTNKVVVTSDNGYLITTNVNTTELNYLSGTTSSVQNQIDNLAIEVVFI